MQAYSGVVSSAVGRLGKWEGRIVGAILVACSVLVLLYGDIIFETYPQCDPEETCEYLLPVFTGDAPPPLTWDHVIWVREWGEFGVFFESSDVEMATLTEAGRSGALRDPMMASGFIAALVVLWLSMPLERLYWLMVRQMEQDGLVPRNFRALAEVEARRRVWAWTVGAIICLIMFGGILNFHGGYSPEFLDQVFLWGSSVLGFAAGHRMGTGFAYGQFARRFQKVSERPRLLPGHADKSGGWRRFGEFMAYLSVLMFIPLMWLSTWIFISLQRPGAFVSCFRLGAPGPVERLRESCDFSLPAYSTYAGWLNLQIPLLVIMILVTYAGLIRPFFKATIPYRQDRARLFREHVAQLDAPLAAAVVQWQDAESLEERRAASKTIGELTEMRETIWALPIVPLRSAVTGVFSFSALYPLVVFALGILLPRDEELTGAIGLLVSFFKSLGL
ncbi:hypothetical protein [Pararhodobacter sp. SW119]|uniref:hypothetical protein n=1 Tax=Pararhodobacter sp. SW119 TaxID=2780075 RepID=UPI001ADFBE97|nr:hypothetical protein [Pararhodobacter sp. SW119]